MLSRFTKTKPNFNNIPFNKLFYINKDKTNRDLIESYITNVIENLKHKFDISNNAICFECVINKNDIIKSYRNNTILTYITYISESTNPLYITEINSNNYKYKNFDEITNVYVSIPNKNVNITLYDSDYIISPNNNNLFTIHVYNETPINAELYVASSHSDDIENKVYEFIEFKPEVLITDDIFNYDFFCNTLYRGLYDNECISKYNTKCLLQITRKRLSDQLNKLKKDIDEFNTNSYSTFNRFLNRRNYKNILDKTTCEWLTSEILSDKIKHLKKNNKLNIFNITNINTFLLSLMSKHLIKTVTDAYNINDKYILTIVNTSIDFNPLEFTTDVDIDTKKSDLINVDIMICKNNTGISHTFIDGTSCSLELGDLIVYNNNSIVSINSKNGYDLMIKIQLKFTRKDIFELERNNKNIVY